MKTKLLLILCILFCKLVPAQINLVPNSNFEDTVACPTNLSGQFGEQIYNLLNWFPASESPDYFNTCAFNQASLPLSGFGYQNANDGNGYIGLYTILNAAPFPNYREYVGVSLLQNLSIGTKYFFKMYVSAAYGGLQGINFFSNNLGIKLSTVYYEDQINMLYPDNNPTAYIDTIFSDTTNWVPVNFSFIADSAYQYLYLGNFFNDSNTDSICAFGNTNGQGAYYFIDGICLSSDSIFSTTWTNISEIGLDNYIYIYPNPSNSKIHFKNVKFPFNACIYNLLGQEIIKLNILKNEQEIDVSFLSPGFYFIKFNNNIYKSISFQKL